MNKRKYSVYESDGTGATFEAGAAKKRRYTKEKTDKQKCEEALRLAKKALYSHQPELKAHDRTETTILSMNTTGTVHNLCEINPGPESNERTGNRIRAKRL